MDHDRLSGRQCYFLLTLFLLGNLVTASGARGTHAGWLIFSVLSLFSVGVFFLYAKAAAHQPAGSVFICTLGKYAGTFFTILYCVLSVLLAGDAIRLFADFIVINDLNDAGAWGNSALLTLTVLLMMYCEMHSLGKAAWAVQPLAILFLILSIFFTLDQMDPHRILPLFAESHETLIKGFIGSFSTIITASFFPIFMMAEYAPKKWSGYLYAAGLTACLLLAVICLRNSAVLGYPAISMFRFPAYAAANTHRHSEILISAVFVLCQPFRTLLCLRFAQSCLIHWFPRWSKLYPPLLLGLAVLSGVLSWSSEQVRWRTIGESVTAALFLLGPILVLVTEKIRTMHKA